VAYLEGKDVELIKHDLAKEPPSRELLERWIDESHLGDFVNTRSPSYKERNLDVTRMTKKQAIDLPAYRKQLADIEKQFGALLKQLPGKSEMDALLTDINQAGLGRGLQFELFKPAAGETVHDFYAELPITIKVTGNYHDLGAFASDIGKLSRIVTLNDIALTTASGKDASGLVMDATAKTFRYLDEEELSNQRKAAAAAKKGGKK